MLDRLQEKRNAASWQRLRPAPVNSVAMNGNLWPVIDHSPHGIVQDGGSAQTTTHIEPSWVTAWIAWNTQSVQAIVGWLF